MKRFELDLTHIKDNNDELNKKFPFNSYDYNTKEELLESLDKLFSNNMSGINYIQIFDHKFDV